jgi:tRNA wybutosine-synthesizing protein 1
MFSPDRFKATRYWDDPKTIVDEAVRAQRELLAGYKGHPKTTIERFLEAMHPVHFAISLDGEPTLYPFIVDLIKEIRERGWTAFLVTNGTAPSRLKEMLKRNIVPTNLYISVYATNPEDYVRVTNSFIPNPMKLVLESLKLMPMFEEKGCRTVIRLTLVKGLNLNDPEGYASLISLAKPMFVELKGYTWAGESTKRLSRDAMPTLEELMEFSKIIEGETGYRVKLVDEKSRLVLLIRDEEAWEKNLRWIEEQNQEIKSYDDVWKEKLKGKSLNHLLKNKLLD